MTVVPFLRGRVFEPQDIQAMSTAFDDVCKILNLADQAQSERELLAQKIVLFAHRGQCDAALLRDRTLREIVHGANCVACGPRPPRRSMRSSLRRTRVPHTAIVFRVIAAWRTARNQPQDDVAESLIGLAHGAQLVDHRPRQPS